MKMSNVCGTGIYKRDEKEGSAKKWWYNNWNLPKFGKKHKLLNSRTSVKFKQVKWKEYNFHGKE